MVMPQQLVLLLVVAGMQIQESLAIWCYQCVSTHPGCGEDFSPQLYWSISCPTPWDVCVKVTEKKGADTLITRDCLSVLQWNRRDVPADHYEGCRRAADDPRLGLYTFNSLKELDTKRDYYDSVEYCFCQYDEQCNTASTVSASVAALLLLAALPRLF
ncbi:uncharacterized protein LOC119107242 [Pollicipes pollicipes]|uniref:uncharacterized protein LOC119107242 n=1 Tax=Pollicipes pollicipes TaxID=41117 RepID=UPI0018854429|nr:uncharacterized protein LOC119107242 [Pollicipes pollicipes]XP_037086550.1 uncharacterized protein LOC119107242 [Pollicipes pollicipes]XP_037086551.1 uncharacterized protein LOC119107242 [Pollicipes pollicipes]XP_037086552.1 uncharacterized protein LOC119107242 [Pollicipes pollicipes]XP_037086553.1 uncharacterized protein LOC119107242 [Pollicipes pollicipes]